MWAAFGALLLMGVAAPALAVEGECREECAEARATCHVVAHRAHRVCHEACSENDGSCRRRCGWALRLAKATCARERLECRVACRPDVACDCVEGCAVDLRECRRELYACGDECRDQTQDALEGCRELAQGGAPREEVRACVTEAEADGRACAQMCHRMLQCCGRFSHCVGECHDQ